MKAYCCLEHVEICMEKMIDKYEMAPSIVQISAEDQPQCCGYCKKMAQYVVANDCSNTKYV